MEEKDNINKVAVNIILIISEIYGSKLHKTLNFIVKKSQMKYIKVNIDKKIASITFNNDQKRNSLNDQMLKELESAFKEFSKDEVRAVIIKSNPDSKVWCAGLNIEQLPEPGKDPLPFNHPLESLMRHIEDFNAPVIAMVTGSVWGGGFDLAVTCDIIIGTPNCSFAITPAKIGVPYNTSGLLHFLNVFEMNIAKELFFTAKPIIATRAYSLGLINHLIENDKINDFTYDMAKTITQNSPLSVSVIKKQLNLLGKARTITPETMESINELRSQAYSSYDYQEGKKAFLNKRHPIFKGK